MSEQLLYSKIIINTIMRVIMYIELFMHEFNLNFSNVGYSLAS